MNKIYVYDFGDNVIDHVGWVKVGDTIRETEDRINEQTKTAALDDSTRILATWDAVDKDGIEFRDYQLHNELIKRNIKRWENREWFKCDLNTVKAAYDAIVNHEANKENRIYNFEMRPEQKQFVQETQQSFITQKNNLVKIPSYLWSAKMRFGKCFTTYQLAKAMKMSKILIISFFTNVADSWYNDLMLHHDFEGWKFYTTSDNYDNFQNDKYAYFISAQDFFGTDNNNNIKLKNQWIYANDWDLLVLDEAHYGTHRIYNQNILHTLNIKYQLELSGTAFNITNKYTKDQISQWDYIDEQEAKNNWNDITKKNPYEKLPQVKLIVYSVHEQIKQAYFSHGFKDFTLNNFFKTNGKIGKEAMFIYPADIRKFLNNLHEPLNRMINPHSENVPFSSNLVRDLQVTMWLLKDISTCDAMANLLSEPGFWSDYRIIKCYDGNEGQGANTIKRVKNILEDNKKAIILTCQQLTVGVTIPELTGVFMMRDGQSPILYWQAGFRGQSPCSYPDGNYKQTCYIFDFSLDRVLEFAFDYVKNLSHKGNKTIKERMERFYKAMPILAYDDNYLPQELTITDIINSNIEEKALSNLNKCWGDLANLNHFSNFKNNQELINILKNIVPTKENGKASEKKKKQQTINDNGFENGSSNPKEFNMPETIPDSTHPQQQTTNINPQENKQQEINLDDYIKKIRTITQILPIFLTLSDTLIYSVDELLNCFSEQDNTELWEILFDITIPQFKQLIQFGCIDKEQLDLTLYYHANLTKDCLDLQYSYIN